ncbi:hypothetical protein I4U23_012675 [Adineta vaga]|nr:hypothetical protein I4U23_012675 [Adineta vaga]
MDNDGIDRNRINNNHEGLDGLCCQICQDPISNGKCPFRCQMYEDRRCPPSIHSFFISHVLSYDLLEQHKTNECNYRTKTCPECDKLVLVSEFDKHCQFTGLCIPLPRMDGLLKVPVGVNHLNGVRILQIFLYNWLNMENLLARQRELGPVPTTLTGVDTVTRAREQRCGFLYHILMMLTFILANASKAPCFLFMFSAIGFTTCVQLFLIAYRAIVFWLGFRLYLGIWLLMLFSYICVQGILFFFQTISDLTIIFFFTIIVFLSGCSLRISIEMFEVNPMFDISSKFAFVLCCTGLVIMKLILLLCRFYFRIISIYFTMGFFAWWNFYVNFRFRHASQCPVNTT